MKRTFSRCKTEILNSSHGSHFTNPRYIELLEEKKIWISMDGKYLDNARTERFFRTLKYDRLYINEYEAPRQLRVMLREYSLPTILTGRIPQLTANARQMFMQVSKSRWLLHNI